MDVADRIASFEAYIEDILSNEKNLAQVDSTRVVNIERDAENDTTAVQQVLDEDDDHSETTSDYYESLNFDNTTKKPIIRDKGKMYVINPDLPKICIIVDDFGIISNSLFDKFNNLDLEIAFAIIPGLRNSKPFMHKAVDKGRETLIHAPMEPDSQNESLEPNTLLSKMSNEEVEDIVKNWMKELNLAIGVNNHMGSKITKDKRILNVVFETIKEKNLFFIDSHTTAQTRVREIAQEVGIKSAIREIFLDVPDSSQKTARSKIDQINNLNHKKVVVVITHCHNETKYHQLTHFIDRLKDAGYELVPASKIVD
jgi:polysaccharide deacetylase 2 family uncharacterized protein YibQ